MYLQVFCTYFRSILYVFCQYMYVLHVFARIDATSTFPCFEYVQIRAIHANTDKDTCIYVHQIRTKYVQIHQIVFARIWWYMHVYDSICMYLISAGWWSDGKLSVYVNVCICMYLDSIRQYDSEFSSIAPWNCTAEDSMSTRAHGDTVFGKKLYVCALFICICIVYLSITSKAY
jgi:hypothetical protein